MSLNKNHPPSVFISYGKDDIKIANRIAEELKSAEIRIYMHVKGKEPPLGKNIIDWMNESLEKSDYFLVLFSQNSIKSKWVKREYNAAYNKQKCVIPCILPEFDVQLIPPLIATLHYLDLRQEQVGALKNLIFQINQFEPYQKASIETISNNEKNPELNNDEWMVHEAEEHSEFSKRIHSIHNRSKNKITDYQSDAEIVITIYALSFPDEKGVGKFGLDLIYYRNIWDPSPMFGPIVKDDDRQKFMNSSENKAFGKPELKPGGFAEREDIESFANFKLMKENKLVGLLFLNSRNFPFSEEFFNEPEFSSQLPALSNTVAEISKSRLENYNQRRMSLLNNLPSKFKPPVSPDSINDFFSDFLNKLTEITEYTNLILSVYLYIDNEKKCLKWLWSNESTSTGATLHLPNSQDEKSLLIADVAIDTNNKSRLLHKVIENDKVVQTRLGDSPHSNIVIPVLSDGPDPQLFGILDIHADNQNQFDTDDVQLLYCMSQFRLSDMLETIKTNSNTDTFPLHNIKHYMPFKKRSLDFPVNSLIELNFNPMKFLLHWDKIKELINDDITTVPATVEIWPSMECNYRCWWCRTENSRKTYSNGKKIMTPDELSSIATDLLSFEKIDILISGGGEPLLHPTINEFMRIISNIDGTIGIFTNGTRPKDFSFWNSFFSREDLHRFVRVSFNGHDPESYFKIHKNTDPEKMNDDDFNVYAEARKIVLDLLGLRSPMASIAIGDTIHSTDMKFVAKKAKHAKDLEVDFIQMRPELSESTNEPERGKDICDTVKKIMTEYIEEDFSVIHTDSERAFTKHTEQRCYAMHLVPTLLPDFEDGWTRIMPCSYAINNWGGPVPNLGRMREGAQFSKFWEQMNLKLKGSEQYDPDYKVKIEGFINPSEVGCPQCRYYRLNQRIHEIANKKGKLYLIDQLVNSLQNNQKELNKDFSKDIEEVWENDIINIEQARKAFEESEKLGIIPSL